MCGHACEGQHCRALFRPGFTKCCFKGAKNSLNTPLALCSGSALPQSLPRAELVAWKRPGKVLTSLRVANGETETMAKAITEFNSANLSQPCTTHPKHVQNLQGRWVLLLAPLQVLSKLWWEMLLFSPSSPNSLKTHKRHRTHGSSASQKMGLEGFTETL